MKETTETRGKARHDNKNNHKAPNQDEHKIEAKKLKKFTPEEAHKRATKSEDERHDEERTKKETREGKKPEQKEEETGEEEHGPTASEKEVAAFVKELKENATVEELKHFLEENGLNSSGTDDRIYERSADAIMFGPCSSCPMCGGALEFAGKVYRCTGYISEWSRCNYATRENGRRSGKCKIPSSLKNEFVKKWVETHEPISRELTPEDKIFAGMTFVLSGRMSHRQGAMKEAITRYGGTVSGSVQQGLTGVICGEGDISGGGSRKIADAVELSIPIIREDWLEDSIKRGRALPVQTYNMVGEVAGGVREDEVPWDKRAPADEAATALMAEIKVVGKRGVCLDTQLQEEGGKIYEAEDIIYNCAFSLCDITIDINQYAILQLIEVPKGGSGGRGGKGPVIYLYYKEGRVGDKRSVSERLDVQESPQAAVEEFVRLFEEFTGNPFEPWEREKVFEKKRGKYAPLDMAPGVDVRAGGLGVRQLGVAALHCKLDGRVVEFLKLLLSQETYRFAMTEMGLDAPDLPQGILTDWHVGFCMTILEEWVEYLKKGEEDEQKKMRMCLDYSNKWFSLLHTTRPVIIDNLKQLAEMGAATLESVRDISYASRLIGDLSGDTLDDPISMRYSEMGCEMTPLDREGDDYKMIMKYMNTTMDPVIESDGEYNVLVDDIVMLKSKAAPPLEEITKMPNKFLLWCGTRSSNLLACLSRGFLPASIDAPGVPYYSFGRGIYCTDAACKAAKYGFTAVDRPEGFLVLAIVSAGDDVLEMPAPQKDVKEYEKEKKAVKILGKRTPEEKEFFKWRNNITVPCGTLKDSNVDGAFLDYNEYCVYNPKQVMPVFLLRTRFEGVVTME